MFFYTCIVYNLHKLKGKTVHIMVVRILEGFGANFETIKQ